MRRNITFDYKALVYNANKQEIEGVSQGEILFPVGSIDALRSHLPVIVYPPLIWLPRRGEHSTMCTYAWPAVFKMHPIK